MTDRVYNTKYLHDHAGNLQELRDLLNRMQADLDEGEKLEEVVDLTSLPVFDEAWPHDTTGVFSWDDRSYLVQGDGEQPCWVLVSRKDWDGGAEEAV